MRLASYCPYCGKRRFLYSEGEDKHTYYASRKYSQMWKDVFGAYPLGKFVKMRCELCHRNLAVFREHKFKGMQGRPIVLFLCSLTDVPYDKEECDKHNSCYTCPVPKIQKAEKKRMWVP
jgi:hypothetical protein